MSTYQGIRGLKVRDYTTNPDNPLEGQLWYNKTDQVGKYQTPVVTTAWRTGPDSASSSNRFYAGNAGTATSAISAGGEKANPSPGIVATSEQWNGTVFTATPSLNQARYGIAGCGTSTAAAVAGGYHAPPGQNKANHEAWNGSSWTETTDLNTARRFPFGSGASPAFLVSGGFSPPDLAITEQWNGSTWTEVNDLNTGRAANAGAGTATQAICYAGNPSNPNNALTELWNGTSWTEIADLATGRNGTSPSGSAVAAFAAGTEAAPTNTVTENFTGALTNKTITAS